MLDPVNTAPFINPLSPSKPELPKALTRFIEMAANAYQLSMNMEDRLGRKPDTLFSLQSELYVFMVKKYYDLRHPDRETLLHWIETTPTHFNHSEEAVLAQLYLAYSIYKLMKARFNAELEDTTTVQSYDFPAETTKRYQNEMFNLAMLSSEDVKWVVYGDGDLGVEIFGQVFTYYKDGSCLRTDAGDVPHEWRVVKNREFGESINSKNAKAISNLDN